MKCESRKFQAEQLEERVLLAGNISIIAVPGGIPGVTDSNTFALVGDGADNNLDVTVNGAGEIVLTGLDGTTIEGSSQIVLPAALTPVLANPAANIDIAVALGDGNDTLTISNIDLGGDVVLSGNAGNDFIGIDNSTVAGGTDANPGIIDGLLITDGLPIAGFEGSGNDGVSISNSATVNVGATGAEAVIETGDGADVLNLDSNDFAGDVSVDMGTGNDRLRATANVFGDNIGAFEDLTFDMGAGDDLLEYGGNIFFNTGVVLVDGGDGHDRQDWLHGTPDDQYVNTSPLLPNWEVFDHADDSPTGV